MSSYQDVGRLLMRQINTVIMDALLGDCVPGYNLYSLFRLNDDVLALAHFASKTDIPRMEVRPSVTLAVYATTESGSWKLGKHSGVLDSSVQHLQSCTPQALICSW